MNRLLSKARNPESWCEPQIRYATSAITNMKFVIQNAFAGSIPTAERVRIDCPPERRD
jgi:hypothetical protein